MTRTQSTGSEGRSDMRSSNYATRPAGVVSGGGGGAFEMPLLRLGSRVKVETRGPVENRPTRFGSLSRGSRNEIFGVPTSFVGKRIGRNFYNRESLIKYLGEANAGEWAIRTTHSQTHRGHNCSQNPPATKPRNPFIKVNIYRKI